MTSEIEILQLVTDTDKDGIPFEWYHVRDSMNKIGILALPEIFEYHQKYTSFFTPWINYMSCLSYFPPEDIENPKNRKERRVLKNLERDVRRLMKNLSQEEIDSIGVREFLDSYKVSE